MLLPHQENYLHKLPPKVANKPVQLFPWDSHGIDIANGVVDEIKKAVPKYEVIFIGSLALGIAGQKDVDLSVLCPTEEFSEPHKKLAELFGPPERMGATHIAWHVVREGYDVGIYLTDPVTSKVQEQIDIFNILKNNEKLRKEYEAIKLESNGLPYRDYQIKKYNFFNKVLYEK